METTSASPHQPRLMQELLALLRRQRVASLGTVGDDGGPFVSMVPFAVESQQACLVFHVSGLAAHTANMIARPRVSALVMQPEQEGQSVHALPRLTLIGQARVLEPGSDLWLACREAYLARFPEAQPITELPDFRFVAMELQSARQVAGFGAARSVSGEDLQAALRAGFQR